jgi:hypothetical protein
MDLPKLFKSEDAWLEHRLGRFTASQISKLLTEPKDKSKALSVGAMTYVHEVCSEILTGESKFVPLNFAMNRGKELEGHAALMLANRLGISTNSEHFILLGGSFFGFYEYGKHSGGSPDGLIIDKEANFEIKCPNSDNHTVNLLMKNESDFQKEHKDYYAQIQANMLFSKSNVTYFVSFDDRFKNEKLQIKILEIKPNIEMQELIKVKIEAATNELNNMLEYFETFSNE